MLNRGENIHNPLFVCVFSLFFDTLVIMGNTERPRYTSFRGLSVRSITVLQCMGRTNVYGRNGHF